jgi:hypothetical protein
VRKHFLPARSHRNRTGRTGSSEFFRAPAHRTTHYVTRCVACFTAAILLAAFPAGAWNANADRLVTNQAVNTLPGDIRPFFEGNRQFLVQHVNDSRDEIARVPAEKPYNYIELDHYGTFPFAALPRDYKAAVSRYGRTVVAAHGELPWQIGLYSARLTEAFRTHNWTAARVAAASLAYFVAEAHDPFNTTINNDGRFSGQPRVNQRFGGSLFDRYSLFFYAHPNDAAFISDPTDHAFDICLTAHSWLEQVLLADARARQGLPDYTDEYYDRFYSQAGSILVHQLSDAATDVGSYWLTAWVNAGKPALPNH